MRGRVMREFEYALVKTKAVLLVVCVRDLKKLLENILQSPGKAPFHP